MTTPLSTQTRNGLKMVFAGLDRDEHMASRRFGVTSLTVYVSGEVGDPGVYVAGRGYHKNIAGHFNRSESEMPFMTVVDYPAWAQSLVDEAVAAFNGDVVVGTSGTAAVVAA